MYEKPKREWVKNAAIIFLAVLLVLTFFSNTIMNHSLPEAATQEVTSGSIVARVRGSGVVTATGVNQVKAESNRAIRSVLIKAGQQVETGDILFTLGEGTSEEIEAAEANVRSRQAAYDSAAVSGSYYTYNADMTQLTVLADRELEARIAMEKAKEEADKAVNDTHQLEYLEDQLEKANIRLAAAQEAYQSVKHRLHPPFPRE